MKNIFGSYYLTQEKHILRCIKKHRFIFSEHLKMSDLLQSNPYLILEIYLPLIEYVVKKYAYDNQDHDDIKQEIYLYMIEKKLKYIVSNFNEDLKFTPYILKIIVNTCFEIQRKRATKIELSVDENYAQEEESNDEDIFEAEKFYIEKKIQKHYNAKIILAFKVFNTISVHKNEILNAYRTISSWDLKKASNILAEASKANIPFFIELANKYERCNRKKDSYRRLIHRYLHEFLFYINGPERTYDIKSITQMLILIFRDQNDLPFEKGVV